jgi:hypothetical protein
MVTIWKYPLEVTDEQDVLLPLGARILTVQSQNDRPCLLAIVEPDMRVSARKIVTHGTGHQFSDKNLNYLGTYQLRGGSLIFHVFERV